MCVGGGSEWEEATERRWSLSGALGRAKQSLCPSFIKSYLLHYYYISPGRDCEDYVIRRLQFDVGDYSVILIIACQGEASYFDKIDIRIICEHVFENV